jgi:hypothetical protein
LLKYFPEVILYNYVVRVFNNAYRFHFRPDKTLVAYSFSYGLILAKVSLEANNP